MHEKPRGFPGFRSSPAAFLIDGIQNERMPPDWIFAHEKEAKRRQWEAERAAGAVGEQGFRDRYAAERSAALQTFLHSPEGRAQCAAYEQGFLEFYRLREPDRCHQAAHEAAVVKLEREQFTFPDFSVWLLSKRPSTT
jgi:hypothetical protein